MLEEKAINSSCNSFFSKHPFSSKLILYMTSVDMTTLYYLPVGPILDQFVCFKMSFLDSCFTTWLNVIKVACDCHLPLTHFTNGYHTVENKQK